MFRRSYTSTRRSAELSLLSALALSCLLWVGCEEARREVLSSEPAGASAGVSAGESAGESAGQPAGESAGQPAGESAGQPAGESGGEVAGTTPVTPPYASLKPSLKLKDHRVLEADLSAALDLSPDELCAELGNFSCLNNVHRVTLGGVAAEKQGIYQPSQVSPLTAPIALERVVYSACGERIRRDFNPEGPRDGVFGQLTLAQGGRLADPNGEEVRDALDALFKRALLRPPSDAEVEALLEMYQRVESAEGPLPAASWAWGACFATLTSVEFLFY